MPIFCDFAYLVSTDVYLLLMQIL